MQEGLVNITDYQGNGNQNHNEISSYIARMAIIKQNKTKKPTKDAKCW